MTISAISTDVMPGVSAVHLNKDLRCPCGAPIKAFDFRIEPDEIALNCRRCDRRLLPIESDTASDESAA